MNWFNILERAAWTFVQTFTASFIAVELAFDLETIQSAALTAAIAGGSAVLSLIKTIAQERLVALGHYAPTE